MEIQLLSSASSLFSRNPGNYGKSWPSCQSFPGLRDGPWCSLALFLLVNNLFWICILQRIPAACKSCGRKTGYKSWRRRKDWTSGYSWPLRKPQEGHRLGSRCQHQKCKNEAFELLSWSVSRPLQLCGSSFVYLLLGLCILDYICTYTCHVCGLKHPFELPSNHKFLSKMTKAISIWSVWYLKKCWVKFVRHDSGVCAVSVMSAHDLTTFKGPRVRCLSP